MSIYAFIFARGGSKGLPRKNIKPLAGKPLLVHSIDLAKQIPSIQKIFVSTDDEEIAQIAKNAGAIVINRPGELAGDKSPEWLSWQHAIELVQNTYGPFDLFVSLPTTSPLRNVEDVVQAIAQIENNNSDVCISITKANRSPYFNMVEVKEDGSCEVLIKSEEQISRRQDSKTVFEMTTVVYVSRPTFILNHSNLFDGRVTSIEIPKSRAVDIDDIYDFWFAETLIKHRGMNASE
ncbi:N-acylneuraminate cytidylyltransferase (plasmid) [Legionella adelaidensis]|uniref:CMP-N-acetlyneuraminic acid synthetase n=1 Tax=Legionella adelaidensis TaxID=45056 RepID=A0A0W0R4U8_9GAMM|nr:acylneuraminate cytidylyltransferase family protein [Legionella adelaidensis]KTC66083.1 CMP-N-acetlyneuraminic acid synthetase [Legionella adelaidensis]VEH85699.1 N-acylneuraminate cytidylyltransferase [Legionella adelaidensis]